MQSGPQKDLNEILKEVFKRKFLPLKKYLKHYDLKYLDLSQKKLGSQNLKLLSKALDGTDLTSLNLSSNNIEEGVLVFFQDTLPTKLKCIDFSNNLIEDHIAIQLVHLARKFKLTKIMLSFNCITGKALNAIADNLCNSSMLEIELEGCEIQDKDAVSFIEKLQHTSLIIVSMAFNQITDEAMWQILDLLPSTQLFQLNITSNPDISEELKVRLKQTLRQNQNRLLREPYTLWVLNRFPKERSPRPSWSNFKTSAASSQESPFQYGIEIFARVDLPQDIRDIIIKMIFPYYRANRTTAYLNIFNRHQEEENKALTFSNKIPRALPQPKTLKTKGTNRRPSPC